jgi:hypothetical protein
MLHNERRQCGSACAWLTLRQTSTDSEGDAMKSALAVALVSAMLLPAPQTFSPEADGFIRNWLVLAPMAIDGQSGATAIDKEFLNGETSAAPNARHKVAIGGKVLTWTPHQTSDYYIDFLQSFDAKRGEYVAGYAVAYVIAGQEMKVPLALSSNDQGKAWLNGKPVFKFAETRTLDKDSDKTDVTLTKEQNVLVLKVIKERVPA